VSDVLPFNEFFGNVDIIIWLLSIPTVCAFVLVIVGFYPADV
jgi:hypothetical protein